MKKFLFIILLFAVPHAASAAVLYFVPQELVAGTGEGTFAVEVRLAEAQSINAIQVGVVIPPQFELVDINEANSSIAHFVDKPRYDGPSRTLQFAGIMPGGFNSSLTEPSVRLLVLRFAVATSGKATLAFDQETRALKNDGAASDEDLVLQNLVLPVIPGKDNLSAGQVDMVPPEPFEIAVTNQHPAYPHKRVAVFEARDQGDGIARYGVFESSRYRSPDSISSGEFRDAVSPYYLRDQSGTRYTYVRAWDKAGNYRTALLEPEHSARSWASYVIAVVAVLLLLLLVRKALIYYHHGTPPAP